jgi:hypothetical protein
MDLDTVDLVENDKPSIILAERKSITRMDMILETIL